MPLPKRVVDNCCCDSEEECRNQENVLNRNENASSSGSPQVCSCGCQGSLSSSVSKEYHSLIVDQIQNVMSKVLSAISRSTHDSTKPTKREETSGDQPVLKILHDTSAMSNASSSSTFESSYVNALIKDIMRNGIFPDFVNRSMITEGLSSTSESSNPRTRSDAVTNTFVVNVQNIRRTESNRGNLINIALNPIEDDPEIEIRITPPPAPPRVIYGPPPIAGAPPSYSAVMKIGSSAIAPPYSQRQPSGEIRIQPSPPFIARTPPPSYAEAEGFITDEFLVPSRIIKKDDLSDNGHRISVAQFCVQVDHLVLGPEPTLVVCPRCGTIVVTTTHTHNSNLTHFAALALCLCGCWPCCLLPYCVNSCKTTYHQCPNCNNYLGMYRPW